MEPRAIEASAQDGSLLEVWVRDLSQVAPRAVGWLWPNRVPLGKVTLLAGDPGRGKSLLALDMAARVSRGAPWPESGSGCAPLGRTILLSAEDDEADTIRPRFDALGGDASRVCVLKDVDRYDIDRRGVFSLSHDVAGLEAVIGQWDDVRLVILDPVSAYMGGAESHNNAGIRSVLAPLQALAERTGVAVVAISHLTKRAAASVMYRTMGSLAFVSAARAAWVTVPDRATPGRTLLVPVKCNLASGVTGLAYRIVPHPENPALPTVAWEPEPVALTAEEAMAAPSLTRREEAAAWLAGLLSGGPLPCEEVERRAKEAGYSVATLRRAKQELGVEAHRLGFGASCAWSLPTTHAAPIVDQPMQGGAQ